MWFNGEILQKSLRILMRKGMCAPAVGELGRASASETEKNVVEKWCYFPELFKMTKISEAGS